MDWPQSPDAASLGDGRLASAVELPGTIEALQDAVERQAGQGLAIYPQGGKTALDYGGIPRRPGVALQTSALTQVIDYPAADMTITIESGVTLSQLQATLATEGQRLPLEAPFPDQATLGGIFATDTSGPRRFSAGRPRDLILGVSFVTGDGKLIKGGGRVVKNVAGYDFPKLLTGSLGSLGVITQMTLKVRPKPEAFAIVVVPFTDLNRIEQALETLNTSRTRPIALELLNSAAFLEISGKPDRADWSLVFAFEDNASAVAWQVEKLLEELGKTRVEVEVLEGDPAEKLAQQITDLQALTSAPLSFTASLPRSQTVSMIRNLDASLWLVQSHAGSGIVRGHASGKLAPENFPEQIARLRTFAAKAGGSLILTRCPTSSKESLGVWGDRKADWGIMERIKQALDPAGVMNPGRFVGTI